MLTNIESSCVPKRQQRLVWSFIQKFGLHVIPELYFNSWSVRALQQWAVQCYLCLKAWLDAFLQLSKCLCTQFASLVQRNQFQQWNSQKEALRIDLMNFRELLSLVSLKSCDARLINTSLCRNHEAISLVYKCFHKKCMHRIAVEFSSVFYRQLWAFWTASNSHHVFANYRFVHLSPQFRCVVAKLYLFYILFSTAWPGLKPYHVLTKRQTSRVCLADFRHFQRSHACLSYFTSVQCDLRLKIFAAATISHFPVCVALNKFVGICECFALCEVWKTAVVDMWARIGSH